MKLLITTFLLISTYCFSQKQYEFDYLLEYEITFYKDSIKIKNRKFRKEDKTIKKYYLTNSKKNNYSAVITELDSLNYKMIFKDENGIYSNVTFLKSDLNKAEFINIDCKNVSRYENPFKYQTKNYDFFKLNDTVISEKTFWMYKLESIKPKKVKRKKLGTEYYILDKGTSFHLPILNFSTAYEEWKKEGNLPNGIFQQKYFIDYYGQLDSKEELINYWKTDKKIVINNDCDYTEKK
ncbi:hypothetical protein H9I45_04335 [Polaribacter haliotis]|uniref:GLPGLI family protein n=1 Tax=Polaribacter haliotis TaxID=1888915 RepID=A0A7L8AIC2_9FLAO|nr:hypothetical protein [Polaribacter haliotis]QOD61684.1 hypothetical protein H9I45_04335 [Polaribacter haliotis]